MENLWLKFLNLFSKASENNTETNSCLKICSYKVLTNNSLIKYENIDFLNMKDINCGSFGKLYKTKCKFDMLNKSNDKENVVAIKAVSKKHVAPDKDYYYSIDNEISIHHHLSKESYIHVDDEGDYIDINDNYDDYKTNKKEKKHKYVVQLFGSFEDIKNIYIVMEFMETGDLYTKMTVEGGRFDKKQTALYAMDILKGIEFLQSHNVIHCDIKPENLLLTKEGRVKICDFGFAVVVGEKDGSGYSGVSTSCLGTLDYLSPEMLETHEYNNTTDIWAVGILIYEFLKGSPPFFDDYEKGTRLKISSVQYDFYPYYIFDIHSSDIIFLILKKNPCDRIDLKNIFQHEFFSF